MHTFDPETLHFQNTSTNQKIPAKPNAFQKTTFGTLGFAIPLYTNDEPKIEIPYKLNRSPDFTGLPKDVPTLFIVSPTQRKFHLWLPTSRHTIQLEHNDENSNIPNPLGHSLNHV